MHRLAAPIALSLALHAALGAAGSWGLWAEGGWIEQRLRLGSAHPLGVVEWSVQGAPIPAPRSAAAPRKRETPRSQDEWPAGRTQRGASPSGSSANTGTGPANLRPGGDLLIPSGTPDYPLLSRRSGEQGTVTLAFTLTEGGTAEAIELETSSGHPRLDASAMRFLKETRLQTPDSRAAMAGMTGMAGGRYRLSFVFSLKN